MEREEEKSASNPEDPCAVASTSSDAVSDSSAVSASALYRHHLDMFVKEMTVDSDSDEEDECPPSRSTSSSKLSPASEIPSSVQPVPAVSAADSIKVPPRDASPSPASTESIATRSKANPLPSVASPQPSSTPATHASTPTPAAAGVAGDTASLTREEFAASFESEIVDVTSTPSSDAQSIFAHLDKASEMIERRRSSLLPSAPAVASSQRGSVVSTTSTPAVKAADSDYSAPSSLQLAPVSAVPSAPSPLPSSQPVASSIAVASSPSPPPSVSAAADFHAPIVCSSAPVATPTSLDAMKPSQMSLSAPVLAAPLPCPCAVPSIAASSSLGAASSSALSSAASAVGMASAPSVSCSIDIPAPSTAAPVSANLPVAAIPATCIAPFRTTSVASQPQDPPPIAAQSASVSDVSFTESSLAETEEPPATGSDQPGSARTNEAAPSEELTPEEQAVLDIAKELKEQQEKLPLLVAHLEKKSPSGFQMWQKRYVAVYDYNVYYSRDPITAELVEQVDQTNANPKASIHCLPLVVVNAIFDVPRSREFCVQARDPHSGKLRDYRFRAPTEREKSVWVKGLNDHRSHLLAMLRWVSLNKSSAVEIAWN